MPYHQFELEECESTSCDKLGNGVDICENSAQDILVKCVAVNIIERTNKILEPGNTNKKLEFDVFDLNIDVLPGGSVVLSQRTDLDCSKSIEQQNFTQTTKEAIVSKILTKSSY